jgi:hypothetical protein
MDRSFQMDQSLLRHLDRVPAAPGSVWAACLISHSSDTLWAPRTCHIHPHQQALAAHIPHVARYGEFDPSLMCPVHPACLARLSVARATRTRTSLVRAATAILYSDDRALTYPGDPQVSSRSRYRTHTRPTTACTSPLVRVSCIPSPPSHATTACPIPLVSSERCSDSNQGSQLGRTTTSPAHQ